MTFHYDYYMRRAYKIKNLLRSFLLLINLNWTIRSLTFSRHIIIRHQDGRQQARRLAVSVISDGSVFKHRYCGHPLMLGLLCWPGDPVNVFCECQTRKHRSREKYARSTSIDFEIRLYSIFKYYYTMNIVITSILEMCSNFALQNLVRIYLRAIESWVRHSI